MRSRSSCTTSSPGLSHLFEAPGNRQRYLALSMRQALRTLGYPAEPQGEPPSLGNEALFWAAYSGLVAACVASSHTSASPRELPQGSAQAKHCHRMNGLESMQFMYCVDFFRDDLNVGVCIISYIIRP